MTEPTPDMPDDLHIALYCDDELSPDDAGAFEARVAGDEALAARVATHRALRDRVATVMTPITPPVDLADSIRRAMGKTPHEPEVAETTRFLVGPQHANIFAVAATLALVAGAVLFGIFGPRIGARPAATGEPPITRQATAWSLSEHRMCEDPDNRSRKLRVRNTREAPLALERIVGRPVALFDFSSMGYDFFGAGPCKVPGSQEQSAHFGYVREADNALLSFFVVPFDERYGLVPGNPHEFHGPDGAALGFVRDEVIFFFTATNPADFALIRDRLGR